MASSPDSPQQFDTQKLITSLGAVIVVFLTVLAAIFLATNDLRERGQAAAVTPSPSATPVEIPTTPPPPATLAPATLAPTVEKTSNIIDALKTAEAANTATPIPSATETEPGIILPTSSPTFEVTATPPTPPQPTPTRPRPSATPCGPPPGWALYVVQPGDTLQSLATATNTTVAQLMRANCLTSPELQVGQLIYLPFTPVATPTSTPLPPAPTNTPVVLTPTFTPPPAPTSTPTFIPTVTATPQLPTSTPTFVPTATATPQLPTGTPTFAPTDTATPQVPTSTPTFAPTATATPQLPTGTPTFAPTATATPPSPPTATPTPTDIVIIPTPTPIPPTSTLPVELPTDTPTPGP